MTLNEAKQFTTWAAAMTLSAVLGVVAFSALPWGRDDSDPGSWGPRSGLIVYVDARTGCNYLGGGHSGGITPRLDRNGRHIGCE
jgi:hypothetical protein